MTLILNFIIHFVNFINIHIIGILLWYIYHSIADSGKSTWLSFTILPSILRTLKEETQILWGNEAKRVFRFKTWLTAKQNMEIIFKIWRMHVDNVKLEIVFTVAAPAFDIMFIGCVLNTKIVYTTAEKLTFEAFYWPSNAARCYQKMAKLEGDETNAIS